MLCIAGYPYDVYCDSEQVVYKALGMIRSLKTGAGMCVCVCDVPDL